MNNISAKDVAKEVRRLALEKPDFVYTPYTVVPSDEQDCVDFYGEEYTPSERCLYVHETDEGLVGGCIVGQALINCGVDIEQLHDVGDTCVKEALESQGIHVSALCEDWLTTIQQEQDDCKTWIDSLKIADEKFPTAKRYTV